VAVAVAVVAGKYTNTCQPFYSPDTHHTHHHIERNKQRKETQCGVVWKEGEHILPVTDTAVGVGVQVVVTVSMLMTVVSGPAVAVAVSVDVTVVVSVSVSAEVSVCAAASPARVVRPGRSERRIVAGCLSGWF
jgi:hypothetical protein